MNRFVTACRSIASGSESLCRNRTAAGGAVIVPPKMGGCFEVTWLASQFLACAHNPRMRRFRAFARSAQREDYAGLMAKIGRPAVRLRTQVLLLQTVVIVLTLGVAFGVFAYI